MNKLIYIGNSKTLSNTVIQLLRKENLIESYKIVTTLNEFNDIKDKFDYNILIADYFSSIFSEINLEDFFEKETNSINILIIPKDLEGINTFVQNYYFVSLDNLQELINIVRSSTSTEVKAEELKQEALNSLFENYFDAIIATDYNFKIKLWNNAAERIYGYRADEVYDKIFFDIVKPEYLDQDRESILAKLNITGFWWGEIIHHNKAGDKLNIYVNSKKIYNDQNKHIGYVTINRDISGFKNYETELINAHSEMRQLARHLEKIREEERTRIAREVHDELGQILTTLKMDLYSLTDIEKSPQVDLKERLSNSIQLIDSAIDSVRRISSELRPALLDHMGLMAALEWQVKEFQKRTNIICKTKLPYEINLDKETNTAIFRIFQEILTNITKHSKADKVFIEIQDSNDHIEIYIEDNGIGINEKDLNKSNSYGILGIKERVFLLKGTIDIKKAGEKGTIIKIIIPK